MHFNGNRAFSFFSCVEPDERIPLNGHLAVVWALLITVAWMGYDENQRERVRLTAGGHCCNKAEIQPQLRASKGTCSSFLFASLGRSAALEVICKLLALQGPQAAIWHWGREWGQGFVRVLLGTSSRAVAICTWKTVIFHSQGNVGLAWQF